MEMSKSSQNKLGSGPLTDYTERRYCRYIIYTDEVDEF